MLPGLQRPAVPPSVRTAWKDWLVFFLIWNYLSLILIAVPLAVRVVVQEGVADLLFPGLSLSLPGTVLDMLGIAALGGAALGGLAALFLVERVGLRAASWCRRPEKGYWPIILIAASLMVAVQIGWNGVELWRAEGRGPEWVSPSASQMEQINELTGAMDGGLPQKMALLLVTGLIVPVSEELIFRGAIFAGLRLRFGFAAAALVSSALFGLVHGLELAIPTGLMGLLFAWSLESRKSLYLPMALHAVNNIVAFMLAFYG